MRTLHEINIKGFKSIENAELKLGDLNVVIGANGSGKTNFINAFRLLERVLSKKLQSYVGVEPDRFLHHGRKITPEFQLDFIFDEFRYEFCLKVIKDTFVFYEKIFFNDEFEETIPIITNSGEEKKLKGYARKCTPNQESLLGELLETVTKESNKRWPDFFSKEKEIKFVASALSLLQNLVVYHFHDTSDSSPIRIGNVDIDDNRFFRSDAANLAAYLYWLQQKHPVAFRHIEEHVRLVAPFFEGFVLEPSKLNDRKIKLEWRHKDSDAYFDAWSLSDGTLRFICLATLLLQPSLPALILLDEPELGLHPFAIRILAEMLDAASKKSQVILATQSVTLLDNFTPQNVVVAENDGSRTTFKRLDEEKLKVWLKKFSLGELWEKNIFGGRP
ncbi:MAG: AAA family ATPase [Azoarcus sp.]|jgi:predicted ATPase|nr:AAA family ATPase [Azoarcus sp.]